ncbi:hypothetical protein C8Q80DRAFT_1351515 [Daedaleopsis nitida]|nr:hypothetical protein C8Q80DRAFT_1351515 [Daedaleopsis nitida]
MSPSFAPPPSPVLSATPLSSPSVPVHSTPPTWPQTHVRRAEGTQVKTASSASRDKAKAKPTGVARRAARKVDKWPPSGEVYGAKWWYTRDWHAKFGGPELELQVHYDSLASKENSVRIPFVCIYSSSILMLLEYRIQWFLTGTESQGPV